MTEYLGLLAGEGKGNVAVGPLISNASPIRVYSVGKL